MPGQHVYAIASGKGGVGKTTTAVSLAGVAAVGGRSVVVVDADLGMANVADVLDVADDRGTLHDVLAGDADPVESAAPAPGGPDVLAGAEAVEKFGGADPAALGDALRALRERYDLVLLDTGAGLSHATVVPLGLADGVVLVTTPDPVAVGDAAKTRDLTRRFGGEVAGVVVVGIGGGDLDPQSVAEDLSVPLLASVPTDSAVRESASAGEPLSMAAPDSPAAAAYRRVAATLLGDHSPAGDEDGGSESDDHSPAGDGADDDPADSDAATSVPDAGGVTLPDPEAPDENEDDPEPPSVPDADATEPVVPEGEASVGTDDAADGDETDGSEDPTDDAGDRAGDPTDDAATEPSVPDPEAAGVSFPGGAAADDADDGVTFDRADGDDDGAGSASAPDGEDGDSDEDSTADDDYVRGGDDGESEDGPDDAGGDPEIEESTTADADAGGGGPEADGDGAAADTGDGGTTDRDDGGTADRDDGGTTDRDDDDGTDESRSLLSRLTGGLLGG